MTTSLLSALASVTWVGDGNHTSDLHMVKGEGSRNSIRGVTGLPTRVESDTRSEVIGLTVKTQCQPWELPGAGEKVFWNLGEVF